MEENLHPFFIFASNISVEQLALVLRIREFTVSNFGSKASYAVSGLWFQSVPRGKYWGSNYIQRWY
jgi:hypothetical protein